MRGFRGLPAFLSQERQKSPSQGRSPLANEARGHPEETPFSRAAIMLSGGLRCRSVMSDNPASPFWRTFVLRIMAGTGASRCPPVKCFLWRRGSGRGRERLFLGKTPPMDPLQGEGEFAIIDRWESSGRGFGAEPRGCLRFLLPDPRKEGPVCHDGIQAHHPTPPLRLQRRQ